MALFDRLSDADKIKTYEQMAQKALTHYPLNVTQLTCITIRHNVIFRVDTTDGSYMLRIGYPEIRTPLMVESEMRWLEALQGNVSFDCIRPVRTTDGELLIRMSMDGIPHERLIVVTTWMQGQMIDEIPSTNKFLQLGRVMAELHNFAESYQPEPPFMTFDTYAPDEWDDLSQFEQPSNMVTSAQAHLMKSARQQVVDFLREKHETEGKILLHGDLHTKNTVWHQGRIGVIDFDDCRWGHPLQDWGVILNTLGQEPHYRHAVIEGYQSLRTIPYSDSDFRLAVMYRKLITISFVSLKYPDRLAEFIHEFCDWMVQK